MTVVLGGQRIVERKLIMNSFVSWSAGPRFEPWCAHQLFNGLGVLAVVIPTNRPPLFFRRFFVLEISCFVCARPWREKAQFVLGRSRRLSYRLTRHAFTPIFENGLTAGTLLSSARCPTNQARRHAIIAALSQNTRYPARFA